jgi:catalase
MTPDESNAPEPRAPLRGATLVARLLLLVVIVAGVAGLFLYKGGWFTPQALTQTKMVDTLEAVNGEHPGFRRNHAKGVCISGHFESNGNGVELSKAVVFKPGSVPVIGRFALGGGQPYAADEAHTVRSMALLFQLPDGEEWRTGMNAMPVFVVNSAEGFYDLIVASAPDPKTSKPDPAKMGAFIGKHPEFAKAIQLIQGQPPSSGFADSTYNGLNAFLFTNDKGATVPVRWAMVPVQPFKPFPEAAASGTNQLFDALIADLHTNALRWHLIVTIGQAGDSTADATLPWPADRRQVDVGTLTIDRVESEDTSPVRDLTFDPLILPDGIAGSDDPLLSTRSAAYAKSFTRREGEHKSPSAISPAETAK